MPKTSPQVDAYIARAQPFARPILVKLRALFHRACPDVEETIKWGMPSFEYKGILGGVAAFKKHAIWGLWKAALIKYPSNAMARDASSRMGARKLSDVSQLPPDGVILDLIKQAVALNDAGVKTPRRSRTKPKALPKTPLDLVAALKKDPGAAKAFKQFSPSHKREYIEWITQAKKEETRQRRIAQAIEWMSEGKSRNWKYT